MTLQLQLRRYTTLHLQLQLHYTTLHPSVVVRRPLQPLQPLQKSTTPTTFRPISGFALPSVIHSNQPLLQVSYFETSAIALYGTTGMRYHIAGQASECKERE